jgi:hypothetical protein
MDKIPSFSLFLLHVLQYMFLLGKKQGNVLAPEIFQHFVRMCPNGQRSATLRQGDFYP